MNYFMYFYNMNNILFTGVLLFIFATTGYTQTLIATSADPEATAHHNQRKVVRDMSENIYVVFTDIKDQKKVIKGIKYDRAAGTWSEASCLFNGNNPTLCIGKDREVHMIYESDNTITRIMYVNTFDFISWSQPAILSDTTKSCTLPVADMDSSGSVNIFWIGKSDTSGSNLINAKMSHDTLVRKVRVMTKNEITDIAVANHLQYGNDDLFFALQFNHDSILFLRSADGDVLHRDTIYRAKGKQPCISYNSILDTSLWTLARFQYIDTASNLIEIGYDCLYDETDSFQLQTAPIDYICIDDLALPIGYSYLFLKNGTLYHGFSYGPRMRWTKVLDTIDTRPFYPSLAYKSFNFGYIDFIWMEDAGSHYDIFYKRDPKIGSIDIINKEKDKGFTITGYPNPFSGTLTIKVSVREPAASPQVRIYNSNSQLINILEPVVSSPTEYEYRWSGLNNKGYKVNPGVYVILCNSGNKAAARKVVFITK